MPYIRTVKTSSGATAVQIVYSFHRGSRQIEHIGSAHDDAELELLKAVARQRLAAGQGVLELGPGFGGGSGATLPITASRMGVLVDALMRGYDLTWLTIMFRRVRSPELRLHGFWRTVLRTKQGGRIGGFALAR